MDAETILNIAVIATLAGVVLAALWAAVYALVKIVPGAAGTAYLMFLAASDSGFIGTALYLLLWALAFPLMLAICVIGGIVKWWLVPEEAEQLARLPPNAPGREAGIPAPPPAGPPADHP